MHLQRLKHHLDRLYEDFDFRGRLLKDPIEFPHRYQRAEDIEVVGFISAALSYGRIEAFKAVLEEILGRVGSSPYEFVLNFSLKRDAPVFKGIYYRFNTEGDILGLFYVLSGLLREYRSLERGFYRFFDGTSLASSIEGIRRYALSRVSNSSVKTGRWFSFLFPSPLKGACKRMNLFLRWMVRDRDIDFGIWSSFRKDQLIIPLDTHIARIGQCLGLTSRKTPDWKMASEITESLKRLDPLDPLRYDFALCHQGVTGLCKSCSGESGSCLILKAQETDMKA